jgi:PBP1b-binding outer membrane lipoprotein LpoB
MKYALSAAALAAIFLAGCQSTGTLDPTTAARVSAAQAKLCPGVSSGALDKLVAGQNGNVQAAYATAQGLCANGAPTDLASAANDILTLINNPNVAAYLAKVHISTKGVKVH